MRRIVNRGNLLFPFIFALFAAVLSYSLGQDINWDQQNYHYYDVFSLFHRHMDTDGAPAGVQTYLAPYPHIPFYLAVQLLPPKLAGFALGALHGLNFWLAFLVVRILLRPSPGTGNKPAPGTGKTERSPIGKGLLTVGAVAIAMASPVTIAEIGTSNADIVTSLPILAALLLLLPLQDGDKPLNPALRLLLAAFLMGAAVALKLTNGVYIFGFGAACLFGWRTGRTRLVAISLVALGGMAGAAAVGGPWFWQVWLHFRNPIFPFYNGLFASPDYPAMSFHDYNSMPKSFLDGLRYPLDWALGRRHPSAEVPFRDIRFVLIAAVAFLAALVLSIRRRSTLLPPAHSRLLVFFAVSFPIWLYLFGVQRYAVILELLAGPVILILLSSFLRGWALVAPTLALGLACVLTVHPANWGRMPWQHGAGWYSIDLKDDRAVPATYILGNKPLGYLVPSLPPGSQAFELEDFDLQPKSGTVFSRALALALGQPGHPVRLLFSERLSTPARTVIGAWGLDIATTCRAVPNRIRPVTECDLARTDKTALPAMPVEAGTPLSFAEHGNGYPALLDQWSALEPWGVWGSGPDATMVLRLGQSYGFSGVRLNVRANALIGGAQKTAAIELFANDSSAAHWTFNGGAPEKIQTACLPPVLIGPDRTLRLRFHDPAPISPMLLGVGDDARILTIGMISLSIEPDENCPPLPTQ